MKKGLLIFPIIKDLNASDGILLKNEGIRKGFEENGVAVDVVEFYSTGVSCNGQKIVDFASNRYVRVLQYYLFAWSKIARFAAAGGYDFIWFRTLIPSPVTASFVKQLRRLNSKYKIIIEYGAYPYEGELPALGKRFYKTVKRAERVMNKNSDFVITYHGQKDLDGTPNIPISNGVDLSEVPVAQPDLDLSKGIRFISVSSLKKWHAYERFLEGMAAYVARPEARPIHFDIIGHGPEYDKLVALTKSLGIEPHVTFRHFQKGKALDAIYEKNHISVSTLGFHRIGLTVSSSLKNREYFARGLPVVLSTNDPDMPPYLPYVQYVPEGEAPVDVGEVVAFAEKVYQRPSLNAEIRAYAENQVSWTSKVREVLEHLKSNGTQG